jgi:hypothetical protein
MSFLSKKTYKEQQQYARQIVPGMFVLVYENPTHWGVYKAQETFHDRYIILVDDDYDAPGHHDRANITYEYETERFRASPVIDTHSIKAFFMTEEEANAAAERMVSLIELYQVEIAGPLLKLEMGIEVLLEQS